MKIVSLYSGHDANITFYDSESNKCHIIEIERLVKKRYFRLHVDNTNDEIQNILSKCQNIAEKEWGFTNEYDYFIGLDSYIPHHIIHSVFKSKKYLPVPNHHKCHAMSTYLQSPFEDCLIFSYDGGGDDGHFNIYKIIDNKLQLIENVPSDFGGGYLLLASCLREVTEKSGHPLSLSGKMMGLCAYGTVIHSWVSPMKEFFYDRNWKKLSVGLGINLKNIESPWSNVLQNWFLEGKKSYDFAATAQRAYEEAFLDKFSKYIKNDGNKKNVCITGGGALNVILNQRIKEEFDVNTFVAPNPNDCGLSLGAIFLNFQEIKKLNPTYSGLPILDYDNLPHLLQDRRYENSSYEKIAKLLIDGNIIGVCIDDSEVGPRALGNRSIICNPSFKDMKDILNSKVKFREWYRPFAPFCLEEHSDKFFKSKDFKNFEFMGYAPIVKDEYCEKLPSITHIDKTSRLQVITKESHNFFYNVLTEFSKKTEIPVLLNTSFNILGNPILSTYEDAFYVLDNTLLDVLVTKDYIIYKN